MRYIIIIFSLTLMLNAKVVTDTDTDLMWQDNSDVKSNSQNYNNAVEYCKRLSLGGYDDWRLPSIDELISITDKNRYNPSIKDIFSNVDTGGYYWTISKTKWNSSEAWVVYFKFGFDDYNGLSYKFYVRCVRGR